MDSILAIVFISKNRGFKKKVRNYIITLKMTHNLNNFLILSEAVPKFYV
jgi:hypothetical protein